MEVVAGDDGEGLRSRDRTYQLRPVLGKEVAVEVTIVLHDAFSAFSASSWAPGLKGE